MGAHRAEPLLFDLEPLGPLLGTASFKHLPEEGAHLERHLARHEVGVPRRMILKIGALDGPAHARPEVFGTSRHGDRTVRRGEHAVQRVHQRMAAVGASGLLAGHQQMGVLECLQPDLPAEQAHIDPLASAGALAGEERRQDCGLEVLRAAMIGHQRAIRRQRPAVESARGDDSAGCLPGDVGAFTVGLGTVGTQEAARRPDDARVHGREIVVAQAPFVERAGLEIRQHHVGGLDQFQKGLLARVDTQVERDRALATVARDVHRRVAVILEHVHVPADIADLRQFDLDDFRAEIVQHGSRLRSLYQRGQIQNSYSIKCASHGFPLVKWCHSNR